MCVIDGGHRKRMRIPVLKLSQNYYKVKRRVHTEDVRSPDSKQLTTENLMIDFNLQQSTIISA